MVDVGEGDGPGAVVASPWHFLRATTGTLVLTVWSAGLALAAGLLPAPAALAQGGAAKGATGRPVGLLVQYLLAQAGPEAAKPSGKAKSAKKAKSTKARRA